MANLGSTTRDATAAADDLLDQVVEAALIETTRETPAPPIPARTPESEAEAFLQRAAAFLNARADRAEILEKLRASVADQSREPKAERPDARDGADSKPE
jgi:hypothetical protein